MVLIIEHRIKEYFWFQTVKNPEFTYAAGEDAAKAALLASLLKSKNKHDLETANKMIKVGSTMYNVLMYIPIIIIHCVI